MNENRFKEIERRWANTSAKEKDTAKDVRWLLDEMKECQGRMAAAKTHLSQRIDRFETRVREAEDLARRKSRFASELGWCLFAHIAVAGVGDAEERQRLSKHALELLAETFPDWQQELRRK